MAAAVVVVTAAAVVAVALPAVVVVIAVAVVVVIAAAVVVVSLYSQPNLTPYRTAVPLTPSVCIHSLIYHLTVQLSHSNRVCIHSPI